MKRPASQFKISSKTKLLLLVALLLNATLLACRVWQGVSADAQTRARPTKNGDVNGDLARDMSDAIYLLAWLFNGGPEPVALAEETGGGLTPEQEAVLEHAAEVLQYFKVLKPEIPCGETQKGSADQLVQGDTILLEGANL